MKKLLLLLPIALILLLCAYVFHGKNYKSTVIEPRMPYILGKYSIDNEATILSTTQNYDKISLELNDRKECELIVEETKYKGKWSIKSDGTLRIKANERIFQTDIYPIREKYIKLVFGQLPEISGFIVLQKNMKYINNTVPKRKENKP